MNLWIKLMNEDLATKSDLKDVRAELKSEIQSVRSELKADIQELRYGMRQMESRLTIKLGGLMALGLSIMAILNKL